MFLIKYKPGERELLEYLKSNNFDKQFEKLTKKLQNKTIIIYGAGKMFQEIQKNYDLSKLNIVGFMDRKYLPEDTDDLAFGYNIIPYSQINDIKSDVILISAQKYQSILNMFKKLYPKKIVLPFVPVSQPFEIQALINNIPFVKKYRKNKTNTIVLIKANGKKVYNPKIKNLNIKFGGRNNYVEIHEPFSIEDKVHITGGSDNKIIIGANNLHRYTRVLMGSKNTLLIGKNTTTVGLAVHMFSGCERTVTIGDDCMFAWDVMIRTTDAHTVYDTKTKQAINLPKDVTIGNHVWITANSTVLKGTKIASNCMIGTGSILNKEYNEENCMIAGSPAKVIKRGINWDRRGVCDFSC